MLNKLSILKKIDGLITKRKYDLLKNIPLIHDIDDTIFIQFINDWGNINEYDSIKYKINDNDLNNITIFLYIPENKVVENFTNYKINNIICMYGKSNINISENNIELNEYMMISVNSKDFKITTNTDSYLILI